MVPVKEEVLGSKGMMQVVKTWDASACVGLISDSDERIHMSYLIFGDKCKMSKKAFKESFGVMTEKLHKIVEKFEKLARGREMIHQLARTCDNLLLGHMMYSYKVF